MNIARTFVVAAFASAVVVPVLGQDSVIDIGALGPGSSFLWAVNERGDAVGWSELGGRDTEHPILWQDGRLIDLGVLPDFPVGRAYDINDRGQAVGVNIEFDFYRTRAILWQDGTLVDLTPPGATNCVATSINNRGDIVGNCGQAALWRGGQLIPLGLLPGYRFAYAAAINGAGVIVGTQTDFLGRQSIACRWVDGVTIPLALPPGALGASAQAINARGTIAGYVETAMGYEPAIWEGDSVAPLAGTWGAFIGLAWGINDRGEVVGGGGPTGGFVWTAGRFRSLESPLGETASAINNRGVAVGRMGVPSSEQHGAVWPKASTRIAPPPVRSR